MYCRMGKGLELGLRRLVPPGCSGMSSALPWHSLCTTKGGACISWHHTWLKKSMEHLLSQYSTFSIGWDKKVAQWTTPGDLLGRFVLQFIFT